MILTVQHIAIHTQESPFFICIQDMSAKATLLCCGLFNSDAGIVHISSSFAGSPSHCQQDLNCACSWREEPAIPAPFTVQASQHHSLCKHPSTIHCASIPAPFTVQASRSQHHSLCTASQHHSLCKPFTVLASQHHSLCKHRDPSTIHCASIPAPFTVQHQFYKPRHIRPLTKPQRCPQRNPPDPAGVLSASGWAKS